MRKLLGTMLLVTSAVATIFAFPADASAAPVNTFRTVSGSICVPTLASRNSVDYNSYGVHNTSSTTATVQCAVPIQWTTTPTNPTFTAIWVGIYDRNSSNDVQCAVKLTYSDGSDVITPLAVNSTGGGPGSPFQLQGATFPAGVTAFGDHQLTVICTIPGVQSGSFSHVTSITDGSQTP